ncbi:hypothetical protein MRX96_035951 [Rhipicephalus microplus]
MTTEGERQGRRELRQPTKQAFTIDITFLHRQLSPRSTANSIEAHCHDQYIGQRHNLDVAMSPPLFRLTRDRKKSGHRRIEMRQWQMPRSTYNAAQKSPALPHRSYTREAGRSIDRENVDPAFFPRREPVPHSARSVSHLFMSRSEL